MGSREQVLELEEQRLKAMLEADGDTLESMMADGSLYVHSSGGVDSKQEFVEKVRTGALDYKAIENEVEEVSEIAEVALITGVLDISLDRDGVPAEIHIRYLTVWRMGSNPQMLSFQATPML